MRSNDLTARAEQSTFTVAGEQKTVEEYLRNLPTIIGKYLPDGGEMFTAYCNKAAETLLTDRERLEQELGIKDAALQHVGQELGRAHQQQNANAYVAVHENEECHQLAARLSAADARADQAAQDRDALKAHLRWVLKQLQVFVTDDDGNGTFVLARIANGTELCGFGVPYEAAQKAAR